MNNIIKGNILEFWADGKDIILEPKNKAQEIMQNVMTICTTIKGSRPMDRDFGISPAAVDKPYFAQAAHIQKEIIEAVNKYEPRAKVLEVGLGKRGAGEILCPYVKIKVNEE